MRKAPLRKRGVTACAHAYSLSLRARCAAAKQGQDQSSCLGAPAFVAERMGTRRRKIRCRRQNIQQICAARQRRSFCVARGGGICAAAAFERDVRAHDRDRSRAQIRKQGQDIFFSPRKLARLRLFSQNFGSRCAKRIFPCRCGKGRDNLRSGSDRNQYDHRAMPQILQKRRRDINRAKAFVLFRHGRIDERRGDLSRHGRRLAHGLHRRGGEDGKTRAGVRACGGGKGASTRRKGRGTFRKISL